MNDEEPREEILFGRVFEADGAWFCEQGASDRSMATSPRLRNREEAEEWLQGALETAQSQWPDNVTVVLERLDNDD